VVPADSPAQLLAEIAEKADNVQLRCCATMDHTSATTRLVPKDRQRAYALQLLFLEEEEQGLVDPLPEGWHQEMHKADGSRRGYSVWPLHGGMHPSLQVF
jgi:hypothetical protein